MITLRRGTLLLCTALRGTHLDGAPLHERVQALQMAQHEGLAVSEQRAVSLSLICRIAPRWDTPRVHVGEGRCTLAPDNDFLSPSHEVQLQCKSADATVKGNLKLEVAETS